VPKVDAAVIISGKMKKKQREENAFG